MCRYIPGGRYPLLASAHMTILTAKVAGVKHVVGCTPPIQGKIPNATVAAMHFAGADEIFILGGVQAVAAMACGTESMPKADFIAGPGNAFVAEAKRQLFGEVGIDLFAGPTEILIVTDDKADPFTVATDILSQAEHGPDSPAVVITTSEYVGKKSMEIIEELLKGLPTAALAGTSWSKFGEVALVDNLDEAWKLADIYASEHVQIFTQNPREALEKMTNYGALFLGEKTCVSYGDKVGFSNQNSIQMMSNECFRSSVQIMCYQQEKRRDIQEDSGLESFFALSRTRKSSILNPVVSLVDFVDELHVQSNLKDMRVLVTCELKNISMTHLNG